MHSCNKKAKKLHFLQQIKVTHKLTRCVFNSRLFYNDRAVKWKEEPFETVGCVIGIRCVYNGKKQWYGTGWNFIANHTVRAYLVVYNMKVSPIYVKKERAEKDNEF